jgi:nicotinic acid mononucleotide adenylyltransferase
MYSTKGQTLITNSKPNTDLSHAIMHLTLFSTLSRTLTYLTLMFTSENAYVQKNEFRSPNAIVQIDKHHRSKCQMCQMRPIEHQSEMCQTPTEERQIENLSNAPRKKRHESRTCSVLKHIC